MRIKVNRISTVTAALFALAAVLPFYASGEVSRADRDLIRERNEALNSADDMFFSPLEKKPERKLSGFFFHRASAVPAAEQFAEAQKLENDGRRDEAGKAYDRLVRSFPYSSQASQAQLSLGRLREKQGKYKKAFEEYFYMLYFYPENAPADSLLRQMYAIANYYRTNDKESRALDYFLRISQIAPQWEHTPKALLQAGLIPLDNKDYYDAADSFDTIFSYHPDTPEAKTAMDKCAIALYALSVKYPRDDAIIIKAIAVTTAALRDGDLNSPDRETLVKNLEALAVHRSEMYYDMALFYDKPKYTPEIKIAAYKDYLRRFPNAAHSHLARQRLDELEQKPSQPRKIGE